MKKTLTVFICLLSLFVLTVAATGCSSSSPADRIILPPEAAADGDPSAAGNTASEDLQLAAAAAVQTVTNTVIAEQMQNAQPEGADNSAEVLSRGMEGDEVAALQERLSELGYMDSVTGFFGGTTERAVGEFQEDHGIDSDGVVGSGTWALLFPAQG